MGGLTVPQSEVLDEQGHATGQILGRAEVHAGELWHPTVNVWIMNSNSEVLLQRRGKKVELHPGLWDVSIGTHVQPGEDPTDAAMRCLEHDLGLAVTKDQIRHLFNIQSSNPMQDGKVHRTLNHVFLLKRDVALDDCTYDHDRIAELAFKPLLEVINEVGATGTAATYYPRTGSYYAQLFEALETEIML